MPSIFVIGNGAHRDPRLSQSLRQAGYDVLALSSPDEAVHALRCVRGDLLLIDAADPRTAESAGPLLDLMRGAPESERTPVLLVAAGDAAQHVVEPASHWIKAHGVPY